MKKLSLLLYVIITTLILVVIATPSVFAETQEFTYNRSLEFKNINDWKFSMYPMDPNMYIRSPRILVDEDTLKTVQVPNFAIVKISMSMSTPVVYTETIEQSPYQNVYLYFYSNETAEYPAATRLLTNQGPGALSSYRLNSPYTMVSTRKYVEIVYVMKESLFNAINNKTYEPFLGTPVNSYTLNQRLATFMMYTAESFNHTQVEGGGFYNSKPQYKTLNKSQFVTANYEEIAPPGNPDDFDSIEDLPSSTIGGPNDSFNGMGSVYFDVVEGNDLVIKVTYGPEDIDGIEDSDGKGEWYVPVSFQAGTDMSIFTNSYLSYYYVENGSKFILINHGNSSMFNAQNKRTQTWIDYSIWNLDTNEIVTYERFNVYMYSRMEEASNVYAYFYVDEFIIDRLLSVSLTWKWRYIPWIGSPGRWNTSTKVLEAGVTELPEDPTHWMFNWSYVDGLEDLLPTVLFPGFFLGTTAVLNVSGAAVTGPISQIQKVTSPTSALISELNSAYSESYTDFNESEFMSTQIWKLYLGQFNAWGNSGIEIDREFNEVGNQKGINIIQFTYVTNGELYTIDGEDINVVYNAGPGTDGESPNFDPWGWLSDIPIAAWIIVGIILVVLIIPIIEKVFTSIKKISKRPILFLVAAAILLIILFLTGVI